MKLKILLVIVFLLVVPNCLARASSVESISRKAEKSARKGQVDFAFMRYRSLLSSNPKVSFRRRALFAMGEYYYMMSDHKNATKYFNEYLKVAKNEEAILFASVYLFDLAKKNRDVRDAERLENEIKLAKRNSFIFDESKEYSYWSPLNRMHKAVYNIDEIRIYVEGENIASIVF